MAPLADMTGGERLLVGELDRLRRVPAKRLRGIPVTGLLERGSSMTCATTVGVPTLRDEFPRGRAASYKFQIPSGTLNLSRAPDSVSPLPYTLCCSTLDEDDLALE